MDRLIVNPSGPVESVLAAGVPTVLLGSRAEEVACDVVTSDTYGGMRLATRLLLDHGHTRVGFIRGRGAGASAQSCQRGYADELADRGIAVDPELIVEAPYTLEAGRTYRGCHRCTR
jgi:LacI family transcriptional regulator